MAMYLEDPFKKVSYSFRIEERLLEDIKLYSKATGKRLPETFNDLLKEVLEGVTVDNTYLNGFDKQLITIPNLITNDNDYRQYGTIYLDPLDILNPELEGFSYVVKQIPNNLDVWDNRKPIVNMTTPQPIKDSGRGYKSRHYPELLHEGIEFVLIPDMIKPIHLDKFNESYNKDSLYNCLVPIYFTIDLNNKLSIEILSKRDTMIKIKDTNNFELLDHFKVIVNRVKEIIDNVVLNLDLNEEEQDSYYYKGAYYTDKTMFLSDVTYNLQSKLIENIGDLTNNIVPSIEASLEMMEARDKEEETQESKDSKEDVQETSGKEIYNIIRDLKLENEKIKNENKALSEEMGLIKKTLENIEQSQEDNLKLLGLDIKNNSKG